MIIVSQLLDNYYRIKLRSTTFRKSAFTQALHSELRKTRKGKALIRNIHTFLAKHPEVHEEITALLTSDDYQKDYWSSDLGFIWYEATFRTSNVYYAYAKESIIKNNYTSVLDVGCGWGDFSSQCASLPGVKKSIGIDITEDIIENARKKNPQSKAEYYCKNILDITEHYDMITLFGSPDYIPPTEFFKVIEHAVSIINRELIVVSSLRKMPFEECLKLEKAVEIKRYDAGYIQPLNFIIEGLRSKHNIKFEVIKFGIDSQMAIVNK